ncbi:MAG: hypothetical protein H7070_15800 [Saprospiraceae bacterium]|nr:hypothetical protein [Pyrinomonadaceae bacterium]
MNQSSFFCPQCAQMKLFQQPTMNHTPHILASVFLCGVWLPFWILMAMMDNAPWRCSFCGFTDEAKYLHAPRLREYERLAAAEKARFSEQARAERGEVTFQESLAYFISDNQKALISVGVAAGILGLLIVFAAIAARSPQTAPVNVASKPAKTDEVAINTRRAFAQLAQAKYEKEYPGFTFSTTGVDEQTLTITSKTINTNFTKQFRKMDNLSQLNKIGFTYVRLRHGKADEVISLDRLATENK